MPTRTLLFIVALLSATSAHAGAWLQPKGDGLFIGQATYYGTARYFDTDGTLQKQARFSKYELQPYVEYGLFDNLTIGGSAYAQTVAQSGTRNYGLADPEFFVRTRLWHDDHQVLSLQPLVKLRSRFVDDGTPRGGSKSTDAELALLYGSNLDIISDRDYIDTRIGYRARNQELSNQWRADAALGLAITPQWQVVPALRAVYTPGLKEAAAFSENGDLDDDVLKAEITTIYRFTDKRWVHISLFDHVAGIQTGAGYGASVGFAQGF